MSDSPQAEKTTKPSVGGRPGMVVALLVVAVVAIVAVWIVHNNNKKTVPNEKSNIPSPVAVSIGTAGYTPANLNVVVNTTVTWTNTDSKPHRVASDPYPTNNGLPGFDSQQALQTNGTYSYTFKKTGVFTYHDQDNPTAIKGTITVQGTK